MSTNFRGLQERLRERILAQIEAGELTGLQLARDTGFQQAHISNFLNHKRGLSLEAMDAILEATETSLEELMVAGSARRRRGHASKDECAGFVTFPIVDLENCTAVQVPNSEANSAIRIAQSQVQRWRSQMATPRAHWQRFIAVRVPAADCEAMSPRIGRGAIAGLDRHYNSLEPFRAGERNVYVVRLGDNYHVRYVEEVGDDLVLRAERVSERLVKLEEGVSGIMGRVCWVWSSV